MDHVASYLASGGSVTKLPRNATAGITGKQWKRLVRNEPAPTELPRAERIPGVLKLRCGHGARA